MNATMTPATNPAPETGATGQRPRVWFTPRFDLFEAESEYLLVGDLPGVAPADVAVTCEKGELRIHGKVGERNYNAPYFAEEYGVGDFHRNFTLGELIDEWAIVALMQDGVLTIHLPKRPEARPRKIEVKSS
jgi:HSP20 family protein